MDKCWKLAETAMKHYAGAPMPVTVRGQNGVQTTFNIKPRSRLVKLMQHSARMCASWAAAAPSQKHSAVVQPAPERGP